MPRRLLLAAEILRDVAETVPEAERASIMTLAEVLSEKARSLSRANGVALDPTPAMETLRPAIRRLAAALDPEANYDDAR